jgi:hypothetical protein
MSLDCSRLRYLRPDCDFDLGTMLVEAWEILRCRRVRGVGMVVVVC